MATYNSKDFSSDTLSGVDSSTQYPTADNYPLYTASEVAELLNLKRSTVISMLNEGRLSGIYIGESVRFRPKDIDAFINGCTAIPLR